MKIIFDTYAWIEYFINTKKAELIEKYLDEEEIFTPWIVLLELSYKADKENWNMNKILKFIKIKSKIIGIDEKFVLSFGQIYNGIKKDIKGIGMADIIIFNSARFLNAKILTGDKHFKNFDDVIFLG